VDEIAVDARRWRDVNDRVNRLEAANDQLKRRTLVAAGLNGLLLIGLACWLAWPGKTLTSKLLTAREISAESIVTPYAALGPDELLLLSSFDPSSIRLSTADPQHPSVTLQHDEHGRIVARLGDGPFLGLYAGGRSADPDRPPQIELSIDANDSAPKIVMRDVNGRVIWHAP